MNNLSSFDLLRHRNLPRYNDHYGKELQEHIRRWKGSISSKEVYAYVWDVIGIKNEKMLCTKFFNKPFFLYSYSIKSPPKLLNGIRISTTESITLVFDSTPFSGQGPKTTS